MLISCWSTKGGAGTTVVAAALGLLLARATGAAVLADLAGDLPAALGGRFDGDELGGSGGSSGAPGDGTPGLTGWLAAAPDVAPDALARLAEPAGGGLALLRRGPGPLAPAFADHLASLLNDDRRAVVADCGLVDGTSSAASAAGAAGEALARGASRSLLVLRPCFLALRRARAAPLTPAGVVLVAEADRALGVADVERELGVPVVARVRVREDVARAVDAGLLAARLPRGLARDLRPLVASLAGHRRTREVSRVG